MTPSVYNLHNIYSVNIRLASSGPPLQGQNPLAAPRTLPTGPANTHSGAALAGSRADSSTSLSGRRTSLSTRCPTARCRQSRGPKPSSAPEVRRCAADTVPSPQSGLTPRRTHRSSCLTPLTPAPSTASTQPCSPARPRCPDHSLVHRDPTITDAKNRDDIDLRTIQLWSITALRKTHPPGMPRIARPALAVPCPPP